MTRLAIAAFAFGLAIVGVRPVAAQDRPVVLNHGLASTGDTWIDAGVRLSTQLAVQVHRPTTDWKRPYEEQASQLQSMYGGLNATTVALGHSNGGVVAREWSKARPLGGIVTLSSPHGGAPLSNNFFNWLELNLNGFGIVSGLSSSFGNPTEGSWWILGVIRGALEIADGSARDGILGLSRLGVDAAMPVFQQMRTTSPYVRALNASDNLAREASTVPNRIGIINVVSDSGSGGIFRAIAPELAPGINRAIWVASTTLDVWALTIAATGDTRDMERASWMWSLAGWLHNHERLWCNAISDPSLYAFTALGQCYENDTVLPFWTQAFPGGVSILKRDSQPHLRQTQGMNSVLYEVLSTRLGIPPRGTGGTVGSPTALTAGQALLPGQQLWSPDGRYRLAYQTDGNLVLYRYDGVVAWSTLTFGRSTNRAVMQSDGNFVVYDAAGVAAWHAGTYGNAGAYMLLNNSGTISVVSSSGATIWSSPQPPWNVTPGPGGGTPGGGSPSQDTLTAGARLYPGQAVRSTDQRFALTYQSDGNLVLYGPNGPRWSTQTFGAPGYAEMQVDGNFVVYASSGTPLWASQTAGQVNARLVVHNDGNVVIYTSGGLSSWSTNTGGS
ncbi:MAG: hypothetical protein ABIT71_08215 [Vicinamibacteraceae bacterium]